MLSGLLGGWEGNRPWGQRWLLTSCGNVTGFTVATEEMCMMAMHYGAARRGWGVVFDGIQGIGITAACSTAAVMTP